MKAARLLVIWGADLMSLLFRLQASFFLVKDDFDRFSWSIADSQDGVYFDRPNGNLLVSS